jgi:hypothetical protein
MSGKEELNKPTRMTPDLICQALQYDNFLACGGRIAQPRLLEPNEVLVQLDQVSLRASEKDLHGVHVWRRVQLMLAERLNACGTHRHAGLKVGRGSPFPDTFAEVHSVPKEKEFDHPGEMLKRVIRVGTQEKQLSSNRSRIIARRID